jgi:hypothetical protein
MLMVAIGLDIPDAGLRNDATRAMPILRDAYVRNLMSYAWTHIRPIAATRRRRNREPAAAGDKSNTASFRPGARVLLAQVASRISP